jgi:sugar O-acyltransferase (sialic acid O-acetyltransferase NeuD family)
MSSNIILVGGGGHCRSCIDVIEQEGRFNIVGIVDLSEKIGQSVIGYPIIGEDKNLLELIKAYSNALITVGQIDSPNRRIELYKYLKEINALFPVIRSPLSYVSPHASIEEGTITMHRAIINAGAKIGKNCIINTNAIIEHDVIIGDHSHISTASVVNGGTKIGPRTFFGSNSDIKHNMVIGEDSLISNGISVRTSLLPGSKILKEK